MHPESHSVSLRFGNLSVIVSTDGRVLTGILLSFSPEKKHSGKSPVLHPLLATAKTQLTEYFNGNRKVFNLPLPEFTGDFTSQIHKAIYSVPFGKTVSYKELAEIAGFPGAYRAAGTACGANPIPIVVPCHRVLKSGAFLGGFSSGLDSKRALLKLEGISYKENR